MDREPHTHPDRTNNGIILSSNFNNSNHLSTCSINVSGEHAIQRSAGDDPYEHACHVKQHTHSTSQQDGKDANEKKTATNYASLPAVDHRSLR
ncbi:hypothetical protein PYCCODRAFT_1435006 [Trametes coccinea BRFM310]|uniref:Uncharacterized protein n=1 Tax=Trametes coccinea (strain BRFM310) TaxID=1353009 RepID=A0A1Y2IPU3_TRAC3|nr:hypothetical protein PYCCODRAFT_1435006 [Trametes coccinea BRFM310]